MVNAMLCAAVLPAGRHSGHTHTHLCNHGCCHHFIYISLAVLTWSSTTVAVLCSLPDAPGDAASNLRANGCRACPPPQKAPAPCESSYPMAPANVNTYLTSSRTAFSKSAVKSKRYVAKSQGTACETPAPSPQDRVHLQHAATTLLLPQLDVFFNNAAGR